MQRSRKQEKQSDPLNRVSQSLPKHSVSDDELGQHRDGGYLTNTAAFNKARQVPNAASRAAKGVQIDEVIDFAANQVIGDDADACN